MKLGSQGVAEAPLEQISGFDAGDFLKRWRRGRLAALRAVLTAAGTDWPSTMSDEEELLALVPESSRDAALRAVFDVSRKFGLSASRFLSVSFEVTDFADLLARSDLRCWQGRWTHSPSGDGSLVLRRPGCSQVARLGGWGCDYWREALDGWVMGAGEDERVARHASRGHGDSECVDILYAESASSGAAGRWGLVPRSLSDGLVPLSTQLKETGVRFVALGVSERVFYYRVDTDQGASLCGAGGKLIRDRIVRAVRALDPGLDPREITPRAVLGVDG